MAEGAAGKTDVDEPAKGPGAFPETGLDFDDLTAKQSCGIEQMAPMREHIAAPQVGLGLRDGFFAAALLTIRGCTAFVTR